MDLRRNFRRMTSGDVRDSRTGLVASGERIHPIFTHNKNEHRKPG